MNAGCAAGKRLAPRAPAALKPRVAPGPQPARKMRAFFWDKLPDARVPGTFWAAHPPAYEALATSEVLLCNLSLVFGHELSLQGAVPCHAATANAPSGRTVASACGGCLGAARLAVINRKHACVLPHRWRRSSRPRSPRRRQAGAAQPPSSWPCWSSSAQRPSASACPASGARTFIIAGPSSPLVTNAMPWHSVQHVARHNSMQCSGMELQSMHCEQKQ